MDQKLDKQGDLLAEHSESLARIETQMETFVTREECIKTHQPPKPVIKSLTPGDPPPNNHSIKIFAGKNKIVIPAGIIAALAAAAVAIIQAL